MDGLIDRIELKFKIADLNKYELKESNIELDFAEKCSFSVAPLSTTFRGGCYRRNEFDTKITNGEAILNLSYERMRY